MSAFAPTFQYPSHRPSVSDNLRTGAAVPPNGDKNKLGIPLAGAEAQAFMCVNLGAPALSVATAVAASQSVGAAANFILNGTLAAGSPAVVTFDVPRNVVAAWTGTAVLTIRGTDLYGAALVETTASGTSHTGAKAFKTVTSITSSASITAATVGNSTKLGLPYRPVIGGFDGGIAGENTADAGTYVAPIRTTSTGTSADVRGTYAPAGTFDGTLTFCVRIAIQNGPNNSDAFGIPQFATG